MNVFNLNNYAILIQKKNGDEKCLNVIKNIISTIDLNEFSNDGYFAFIGVELIFINLSKIYLRINNINECL